VPSRARRTVGIDAATRLAAVGLVTGAEVTGCLQTSAARTAADLARVLPRPEGSPCSTRRLTVADRGAIRAVRCRSAGVRGVRTAGAALDLADVGAESPMESRLRLCLVDAGLPRPTTQYWVGGTGSASPGRVAGWGPSTTARSTTAGLSSARTASAHHRPRELGWEVFVCTDVDVHRRPERIAVLLRQAPATRGGP
jgi:hypothetical protein